MSEREFILLTAFLTSIPALAANMILPALPNIVTDMGIADGNQRQLIISLLFLGLWVY